MSNLVVFVESAMPNKNGGRDNLYFVKEENYPKNDGKAGDLTILSERLSQRLPQLLIINSKISVQNKDGYLNFEDVIKMISEHNSKYPNNSTRKIVFNRCEDIEALLSKIKSIEKLGLGNESIELAFENIHELVIDVMFNAQTNSFSSRHEESLKRIIDCSVNECDMGYYGFDDPRFKYLTMFI